jgi:type III restriction enzyme
VTVNADNLIKDVVNELDLVKIEPPRIVASKAEVTIDKDKDLLDYQLFGRGVLATVANRQGAPNIVAMIEDLIAHITPPIKLTRKTLCAIVLRTKNRKAALDNPQ